MNLKRPGRKTISSLLIIVGALAIAWALPTAASTWLIVVMAAIGGGLVIGLSLQMLKGRQWARDILLVASILMAVLAIFTLLGGLTWQWVLMGLVSLYLTWGLLAL